MEEIQIGITHETNCPYLPEQQERLGFCLDPICHSTKSYASLLTMGFRRNGNHIYRPECKNCQACQSLRVDALNFSPSKTQKKQRNQLKNFNIEMRSDLDPNWFALYEKYIAARHRHGDMYPADCESFLSFIQSQWQTTEYLHLYQDDILLAIAVMDVVEDGYSALYTFFEPEHPWSLGTLAILAQIEQAKKTKRPWLYLGFYIEACDAMKYKIKYRPNERYNGSTWIK